MSQLIELVWRNKAYLEGTSDPDGSAKRHGALFAGFSTEMSFLHGGGFSVPKDRGEVMNYDRVLVYPGMVQDSAISYRIGPQRGLDPASLDLPMTHQIPRTVATTVFNNTTKTNSIDKFHTETTSGYGDERGAGSVGPGDEIPVPDEGRPKPFLNPGMMIRKRPRNTDDVLITASEHMKLAYIPDIDYNNPGECALSIDLQESIAGTPATLKKVVLQFSKENHHISEVTLDFSDVTRGSGSISSSTAPRQNSLTILCDGKKRLQDVAFDCKMGNFGANKFKLTVSEVKYFPPLATPAGGFDPGSQVAILGDLQFGCEKNYEPNTVQEDGTAFATSAQAAAMGIARLPMHAMPNPLRDATVDDLGGGAQNVADAVNKGYDLIGQASVDVGSGTAKKEYSATRSIAAGSVNAATDNIDVNTHKNRLDQELNVQWRRVGCSSYTVKQREPKGTLLAVNIILQADAY